MRPDLRTWLATHVAAWLGIVLALASISHAQTSPSAAQLNPGQIQSDSATLAQYDRAIAQVAERAMRAVVEIQVSGYGPPEHATDERIIERQHSLGSGVIVDSSGYIMTNNHVVAGAERIRVVLSRAVAEMTMGHTSLRRQQRTYPARLVGASRTADLALIEIDASDLPTMPLAQQFTVRLGQAVLAIGAPEGLDYTLTKGIVSAVGRQPDPDKPMVYIQTDAPINPGNSGGPLIDRDGNLIVLTHSSLPRAGAARAWALPFPSRSSALSTKNCGPTGTCARLPLAPIHNLLRPCWRQD